MTENYGFDTLMIHAGQEPDKETYSVCAPIYQTTAYSFENTDHARELFELSKGGNIYTRITNPTTDMLEKRIAALDGGIGALAMSSGHACIFNAIINVCESGDEVVSSINIYGGAINLLGVTLKRLGITVKFVNPDNLNEWEDAITDKTKMFFTELVGNPNANVADISAIAKIAHNHGILFMVDSTFTTPYLCKPIEFGADLVIHSATKFIGGHGNSMCGIIVDSGNFNFKGNVRYPLFNEPDQSYHGMIFADIGAAAFITRLRVLMLRDVGACVAPFNSFMILQGVETLSLRMKKHCENAQKVAEYLERNPNVKVVNYPLLKSNKYYDLAQKYTPNGCGSVFTFELSGTDKSSKEIGAKFIDNLKLLYHVANVGDVRSLVIHPASTTHSQLSPEQLKQAGISEGTIRLSIGIEEIDDIIADLEQAINIAVK